MSNTLSPPLYSQAPDDESLKPSPCPLNCVSLSPCHKRDGKVWNREDRETSLLLDGTVAPPKETDGHLWTKQGGGKEKKIEEISMSGPTPRKHTVVPFEKMVTWMKAKIRPVNFLQMIHTHLNLDSSRDSIKGEKVNRLLKNHGLKSSILLLRSAWANQVKQIK